MVRDGPRRILPVLDFLSENLALVFVGLVAAAIVIGAAILVVAESDERRAMGWRFIGGAFILAALGFVLRLVLSQSLS